MGTVNTLKPRPREASARSWPARVQSCQVQGQISVCQTTPRGQCCQNNQQVTPWPLLWQVNYDLYDKRWRPWLLLWRALKARNLDRDIKEDEIKRKYSHLKHGHMSEWCVISYFKNCIPWTSYHLPDFLASVSLHVIIKKLLTNVSTSTLREFQRFKPTPVQLRNLFASYNYDALLPPQ